MLAVSHLRPKKAEWPDVVALFREGSYDACLSAGRTHSDTQAAVLRARALIRLERYVEALKELDRNTEAEPTVVRGECESVRSLAHAFLGRFEAARESQRDARAYLYSVMAPALESELHVNEAKLAYMEGNVPSARRLAERVVGVGKQFLDVAPNDVTNQVNVAADADNLLALIEFAEGNRTGGVKRLVDSLQKLRESRVLDVGMSARVLANLSGNVEGIDLELERSCFELIRQLNQSIVWTSALAVQQFHIVRELGLASALEGDHLTAFREYKRAFNIAPRAELRLQALLDRVFLGTELKQHLLAHADLLEAQDLASTIDWSRVDERDLCCLPTLSTLLAPFDGIAARGVLQSYTKRKATALRTSSLFVDKRFHGEYLTAVAAIAKSEGNEIEFERAAISAFEIFESLNVRWRAAQIALDLRAHVWYENYARLEAAQRPNSWLASKFATA